MFFQKQLKLDKWSCSVLILLVLTTLTVNMSNAQQRDESARSYMIKIEKSTPREVYNTLSASAMHAFMKHLTDPSDTQALEKLVMMCNEYIAKYLSSGQLKVVNYYLGTALVRLGEFQKGVPILERLVETISPDYMAVTQYTAVIMDRFKWNLTERVLLELGLAYDKQEEHDKADAVYNKLATHPKFVGGLQAGIAKHILELDTTLRIGEIPTTHNAWVGKTAPNFGMGFDENKKRVFSLNRYKGHVVLLRFDTEDTNRHNLIQLHDKYKNQKFQIITVNPDVSDPPMPKSVEIKGEAWIHYHDKNGKFINLYQIRNSPAVFLIDSEGVIQKTDLDHTALEKAVDDLVKENLANYNDPRTQAIITKTVKAHGGFEKLQAVENIVIEFSLFDHRGDDTVGEEQTGQLILYRNKHVQNFTSDTGRQLTRIFDGNSVYDIDNSGNIKNFDNKETEHIVARSKDWLFKMPIWLLTTLAQNKIPIEYLGTEIVNGEQANVLRVQQPSGKPIKIYISEKTNYIIQMDYMVVDVPGNVVETFLQYKDVDGIKIPHYWIEKYHTQNEIFLNKIRFNVEIDPKIFDPKVSANIVTTLFEAIPENLSKYSDSKAIITSMVKAHGGSEKLQTVKNMVRDYSLFIALPDGTLHKYGGGKAYLYPNKYRSDFHSTDGGNYKMMSDGKNIYFADGNTFGKLDDDEAKIKMKQDKDMAFREPIWLLKTLAESKTPVEYVGIENVKDEPANVLRVKQPSGIPIKIYISSKTHYLVKIVIEGETDKTVKLFKGFKDVDGIILPQQSITITEEEHHETHFSNNTINAIIDPKLFDPQEIKK